MIPSFSNAELKHVVLIGDKVLIKPQAQNDKTKSGLLLPPGVQEKEPLQVGYVIKAGPGYPIPSVADTEEPWKGTKEPISYVPIQPQEGDLALFLQNNSWEITFNNEKYFVVPNSSILMLVKNTDFFD